MKAKLTPSHGAHFAVVSNPGTIFERIEDYCPSLMSAHEVKGCYDDPVDILRILPDGELSTDL